jgi:integrase
MNALKNLCKYFGEKAIGSITTEDLTDWANQRVRSDNGKPISASTYKIERASLIMIFEYAKANGFILHNRAQKLQRRKIVKRAPKIPSREEFRKLILQMEKADIRGQEAVDFVKYMAYAGTRRNETKLMRWDDISFERGNFTVRGEERGGPKNGQERVVPLFPPLKSLLLRMLSERPTPKPGERIFTIADPKKCVESAIRKAGLPHFAPNHSFRKFFITNALEEGVPANVVAQWVGHSDGGVLVLQTYSHVRNKHSEQMAKLLTFSVEPESPANVVPMTQTDSTTDSAESLPAKTSHGE